MWLRKTEELAFSYIVQGNTCADILFITQKHTAALERILSLMYSGVFRQSIKPDEL